MTCPKYLTADELDGERLASLNEDQSTAVIELLYLVALADGQFTADESAQLRAELERLPWAWGTTPDAVRSTVSRAWQSMNALETEEEFLAMAEALAEQVPAGEVRETVFRMASSVVVADGCAAEELRVLGALRSAFCLA